MEVSRMILIDLSPEVGLGKGLRINNDVSRIFVTPSSETGRSAGNKLKPAVERKLTMLIIICMRIRGMI